MSFFELKKNLIHVFWFFSLQKIQSIFSELFKHAKKKLFFLVSTTHDKVFFKNVSWKSYFPLNDVIFSTFYWNICFEKNVFLETNGSWQNLFEKSTRNCMFPLGHGKKSSISMILARWWLMVVVFKSERRTHFGDRVPIVCWSSW